MILGITKRHVVGVSSSCAQSYAQTFVLDVPADIAALIDARYQELVSGAGEASR